MKFTFLINLLALFFINILILLQVKDLFYFEWNLINFIITVFAYFFVMMILIIAINIMFNFVLKYFTSYSLDYEKNHDKVLNTILLVNQTLFLILYLLLCLDNTLFFTLQKFKYITPLLFSILFSVLLKLKGKDFFLFNLGVILINLALLLTQKIFELVYSHIY